MTFKEFMIIMSGSTFAIFLGWVFVVLTINPLTAGFWAFVFFYTTLFVTLIGLFTLIGTAIRKQFWPKEIISRHVLIAFRHSLLFSLIFTSAILLLSKAWLNWWTMILIILLFTVIEMIFLSSKRTVEH